ncbi:MAG: ribokinase [Actinomycetota bacterium]|nr:ribokinase [Actinomycetota bacterium]
MILVVGSLNLDIVVPVPHHARPGETVLGGDHARHAGGKGANQAVAAARLGASVAMLGRVGDDDAGRVLLGALGEAGVATDHVLVSERTPSGIALITVDDEGENAIVVSPGANARLDPSDVEAAAELIEGAGIVLLQLEVPLRTVERAAKLARGTVILNPAPAVELPASLLERADVLVPNRGELELLSHNPSDVAAAARQLEARQVVVTLGAEGALVVTGGGVEHISRHAVEAVDTTAAGDCFCGALAAGLDEGLDLAGAARQANAAAALSTTRKGAQPSLPTSAELDDFFATTRAPRGPQ